MKSHRAMIVGGIGLAAVASALWAADDSWAAPARSASKGNPVPANEQSLAAGRALYAQHCLSCHGVSGAGNGPAAKDLEENPGDLTAVVGEQSDGAIFWKITTGRKPMPSFEGLTSETQRWQIVNYVRTLGAKGGQP